MPLFFAILFLLLCPSFAEEPRLDLYSAACATPGDSEAMAKLIESEVDLDQLETWLIEETTRRNDVSGWRALAEFYQQAGDLNLAEVSLGKALVLDEGNVDVLLTRAKLRLRQRHVAGASEDLETLRKGRPEVVEWELMRVSALQDSGKAVEACLKLASELPETASAAEVEAIWSKLSELGLRGDAKDFLMKRGAAFQQDWRLQFFLATVLEEEGREAESGEIFRRLLKAKGEVVERFHLNEPFGFRSPDTSFDELRLEGWLDGVIPASRSDFGILFYFGYQIASLPDSAIAARVMSFGKSVKRGESPELEGVDAPELLAALIREDGSFEKEALAVIAENPDDLKVRASLLKWGKFTADWDESVTGVIWSSIERIAPEHPVFAIEMTRKFVGTGLIEPEQGVELVASLLEADARVEIVDSVVGFAFGWNTNILQAGEPEVADHGLRELLLQWALSEHGEAEPDWLPTLGEHLLREGREGELMALVNRYSRAGVGRKGGRWLWFPRDNEMQTIMSGYEQAELTKSLAMGQVVPSVLRRKVPKVADWLIRKVELDGERAAIRAQLQNFYPELRREVFSVEDVKKHLGVIEDLGVRGLFTAMVGGEELDGIVVELEKSNEVSDRVFLSWMEESRGNVEKAFEVLMEIDRSKLTARESLALDRRLVTLGALRVRVVSETWEIEAARSAWRRLLEGGDGGDLYYLKQLAPLLGMEDSLPRPVQQSEVLVASLEGLAKVKDLVLKKQFEAAISAVIKSLQFSDWRTSEELSSYLKEQKLAGRVLAKMREESKGSRELLKLAALAREFGETELAEESYRKLLEGDPGSFEAYFGLLALEEVGERDFGAMIEALSAEQIEEGVRLWGEQESRQFRTNRWEELVLLGLVEELLQRGQLSEGESAVARFVARWEIVDYGGYDGARGFGQSPVRDFEGSEEVIAEKEKAISTMMLDHGPLAEIGFAKLHVNQKEWKLTDEELIEWAKRGFRSGLIVPKKPVVRFPAWPRYHNYGQRRLVSPADYLREKGKVRETLDEPTMILVNELQSEMAKSLAIAKRISSDDGGAALREWREALPREKQLRQNAVLGLVDDVLVFASETGKAMDDLEKLWLETMAEEPHLWSFNNALVGRWLRWRTGTGGAEGFVERILIHGLGPKEAWAMIGEVQRNDLPAEILQRVSQVDQLLPVLFREEAARKKLMALTFRDGLLGIYRPDRFVYLLRRLELEEDREKLAGYCEEMLRDLAKESAALSGEKVAQFGLFLMKLMDEHLLKQVMMKPQVREVFESQDWHPKLRSWVGLLAVNEKREKFRFLNEVLKEKELFREMAGFDSKVFRESLRRHFWSDYDEAEPKINEVLGVAMKQEKLALGEVIDRWVKGEVEIDRQDQVGHTMWKRIFEYAKVDPVKAGAAAGGVMEAALRDRVRRDFHSFSSYYFTALFGEARLNLEQEVKLLGATYESGVNESLPTPQDLDNRFHYFLWGSIRSVYPGLQRVRGLPGEVCRKIFLNAASELNLKEQTVLLSGILPGVFADLNLEEDEGEPLLIWIEESLRGKSELLADGLKAVVLQRLGRVEERRVAFDLFLNRIQGPNPILLGVAVGFASEEEGRVFFDDPKVWERVGALMKTYRNGQRQIRERSGVMTILTALSEVEMENHEGQVTKLVENLAEGFLSSDGVTELGGERENLSLKGIVRFLNSGEDVELLGQVVRKYQEKLRGDLWALTHLLSRGRVELAGLLVQSEGERYHIVKGLSLETGVEEGLTKLLKRLPSSQRFHLEVVIAGLAEEGRLGRLVKLVERCGQECPEGYRAKWQVLGTFAREKALGAALREEFLEVAKDWTIQRAAQIDGRLPASDSAQDLLIVIHRAIANDLMAGQLEWAIREVRALAAAEPEAYSDYLSVEARVVLEELVPLLFEGGEDGLETFRLLLGDAFNLRSTDDLPLVFWAAKFAHERANVEGDFESALSALTLSNEQRSNLEWCLRDQGEEYGKKRIEALGGWTEDQEELKKEIVGLFLNEGE